MIWRKRPRSQAGTREGSFEHVTLAKGTWKRQGKWAKPSQKSPQSSVVYNATFCLPLSSLLSTCTPRWSDCQRQPSLPGKWASVCVGSPPCPPQILQGPASLRARPGPGAPGAKAGVWICAGLCWLGRAGPCGPGGSQRSPRGGTCPGLPRQRAVTPCCLPSSSRPRAPAPPAPPLTPFPRPGWSRAEAGSGSRGGGGRPGWGRRRRRRRGSRAGGGSRPPGSSGGGPRPPRCYQPWPRSRTPWPWRASSNAKAVRSEPAPAGRLTALRLWETHSRVQTDTEG